MKSELLAITQKLREEQNAAANEASVAISDLKSELAILTVDFKEYVDGQYAHSTNSDESTADAVIESLCEQIGQHSEQAFTFHDDGDVTCNECDKPALHYSLMPCDHFTCHICSFRRRLHYKDKTCATCNESAPYVIFADTTTMTFVDYDDANFHSTDEYLGIKYGTPASFQDTVPNLRYNCPEPTCVVTCLGWPDLRRHIFGVHHKEMYDFCIRNKKLFVHSQELYTRGVLHEHLNVEHNVESVRKMKDICGYGWRA